MTKTSAISKRPSVTLAQVSRLGFLVLLLSTVSLVSTGCNSVSRKKIEAAVWATNAPLPAEICERDPEVAQYGFFRRLNDGRLEFVSFCSPEASLYVTMYSDDFERILNEAFGTRRPKRITGNSRTITVEKLPGSYQESSAPEAIDMAASITH